MKKKLLLVNNIPTSYRNALFQEIFRMQEGVSALFLTEKESVRDIVDYRYIEDINYVVKRPLLQCRKNRSTTSDYILQIISPNSYINNDALMFFGYSYFSIIIMAAVARLARKTTVLFCETTLQDARSGAFRNMVKGKLLKLLFTKYIAPGEASQEYLLSLGVHPNRIMLAHNGVPRTRDHLMRSTRINLGDRRVRVGMVGRLSTEKRFDWALRCLIGRDDLEFHIAGNGPLKDEISKISGEGQVTMYGHLGREDLTNFYRTIDILLLPSSCEPWGFVVNEAVEELCPIVLSQYVGCRHEFVPEAGVIFRPDECGGLSHAIDKVIENYEGLVLGAVKLRDKYSIENQAKAILMHLGLWND